VLSRRKRIKFARRFGETTKRTRIKVEKIKNAADRCAPGVRGRVLSNKTADNTDMKPIEPKINVNCDCCTNTDYGTRTELETAGWRIEKGLELCPVCRYD
jgi:hypothetical protein